jgi:hypothetical protein
LHDNGLCGANASESVSVVTNLGKHEGITENTISTPDDDVTIDGCKESYQEEVNSAEEN